MKASQGSSLPMKGITMNPIVTRIYTALYDSTIPNSKVSRTNQLAEALRMLDLEPDGTSEEISPIYHALLTIMESLRKDGY